MDGTFTGINSANKLLKDIAWGAATQGVAVLRFNKRTFQYGIGAFPNGDFEEFTIADEYTYDTLAALALLRTYTKVDHSKIILAGHSLGAEVMPHIAQQAQPPVNGVLLLAAVSTSLPDVLPWQEYYLSNLNVTYAEYGIECRDLIQNATLTPKWIINCGAINPSLAAFNSYGNYWLSLRTYDTPPDKVNQLVNTPVLVLQGEADYNVPYAIPKSIPTGDVFIPTFARWQSTFKGSHRVTLKSFKGLSHNFMFATNTGLATPAEEAVTGHVDSGVIRAITDWAKAL